MTMQPALAAFVQQRVYELFSDRAQMIARFNASFSRKDASGTGQPDVRMSVPLAYLFLLNAVENDTLFLPNADLSPEGVLKLSAGKKRHALVRIN